MSDGSVGGLLREWRRRRKLSQLELAIRAEVSSRHVSFVETGRTTPSAAMVLHLAEHLAVPLRERNRLLVAAGHAPVFRQTPLDDPDMSGVRAALEQVLQAHSPYPALAVDRRWNLLLANDPFNRFLDSLDPKLRKAPINLMRLGLHPDGGLASRISNLAQVRAYLLPRLAHQAAVSGDPELHHLHDELVANSPFGTTEPERPASGADAVNLGVPDPAEIALPIRIRHRGAELTFLTTVTTFGTAFDITLDEIAIETYLPAGQQTAAYLRRVPNNG
ncbi:helix-turn-helix transcriptional regulator [Kribbella solani]|uniref:helix-turn-helix domain-containing protein n=1 Tax=Kribbella solani TaxID=236067 RepID=UPI0029BB4A20|nr:helix-turn-helix transcriptional regulator [Kribbella solani]MDX3004496.1 helix-turn-helix transcriptional regulator [Kribbella solani]